MFWICAFRNGLVVCYEGLPERQGLRQRSVLQVVVDALAAQDGGLLPSDTKPTTTTAANQNQESPTSTSAGSKKPDAPLSLLKQLSLVSFHCNYSAKAG